MCKFHSWCTFLGTYAIYYPMHYLGFLGVPRRYYAMGSTVFIPDSAQTLNEAITIAALIVGAVQVVFLYNLIWSYFNGKPSGGNPCRETTPKYRNFGAPLPVVYRWAYDYSVPGCPEDFIPQNQPPAKRAEGLEKIPDASELGAQALTA